MVGIGDMASYSKAAYSERNCPKSTLILTVKSSCLSFVQGKENRLSHKTDWLGQGDRRFVFCYLDSSRHLALFVLSKVFFQDGKSILAQNALCDLRLPEGMTEYDFRAVAALVP